MADQKDHAKENAQAHLDSIVEQVKALDSDFAEPVGDWQSREDVQQSIQETPLSIEVRSGWRNYGREPEAMKAEEFRILLTTGGPACQIIGDLDEYGEPESAVIQFQDWFRPWVNLDPREHQDALLTWCKQFYFGE